MVDTNGSKRTNEEIFRRTVARQKPFFFFLPATSFNNYTIDLDIKRASKVIQFIQFRCHLRFHRCFQSRLNFISFAGHNKPGFIRLAFFLTGHVFFSVMRFNNLHDCAKETRHQAIDYSFMLMYRYIANWISNLELTRNLPICVHGNLWGNHYQLKRDTHNTKSCQVKTTWPRPVAPRSNNRSVDRPLSTLVVFIFVLVKNFIVCIIRYVVGWSQGFKQAGCDLL